MRFAGKGIKEKIQEIPMNTNPNPDEITELFVRLYELGYKVENTGKCLYAKQDEYVVFYSRQSDLLECYFLGYGHNSVKCSLQDFRDVDHIILWQEEQKSMTLTELTEIEMYEEPPAPRVVELNPDGTRRYKSKKRELFLQYYNMGYSDRQIAEAIGTTVITVYKHRKVHGLKPNKPVII